MKKVMTIARKWAPFLVPILIGSLLIFLGSSLEKKEAQTYSHGLDLHNTAFAALEEKDYESAYELFIESSFYSIDPSMKAIAFYNAATIAWPMGIADYGMLVELYKESLRNAPDFYEASFNLEYLYMLEVVANELLPGLGETGGEGEGGEGVPGGDI